eukprot:TRINITY_DN1550_c0_g3_i1.p2 TRINITY_DN1550_c0_g3~~TRINITY_DN1550_c0_g3_i1.p2  ORF type:complete len:448 (-),score=59.87 TRINITY_DN1550_c0_g3_i1:311-1654(-)
MDQFLSSFHTSSKSCNSRSTFRQRKEALRSFIDFYFEQDRQERELEQQLYEERKRRLFERAKKAQIESELQRQKSLAICMTNLHSAVVAENQEYVKYIAGMQQQCKQIQQTAQEKQNALQELNRIAASRKQEVELLKGRIEQLEAELMRQEPLDLNLEMLFQQQMEQNTAVSKEFDEIAEVQDVDLLQLPKNVVQCTTQMVAQMDRKNSAEEQFIQQIVQEDGCEQVLDKQKENNCQKLHRKSFVDQQVVNGQLLESNESDQFRTGVLSVIQEASRKETSSELQDGNDRFFKLPRQQDQQQEEVQDEQQQKIEAVNCNIVEDTLQQNNEENKPIKKRGTRRSKRIQRGKANKLKLNQMVQQSRSGKKRSLEVINSSMQEEVTSQPGKKRVSKAAEKQESRRSLSRQSTISKSDDSMEAKRRKILGQSEVRSRMSSDVGERSRSVWNR